MQIYGSGQPYFIRCTYGIFAGISSNTRSYKAYIYGSGQPQLFILFPPELVQNFTKRLAVMGRFPLQSIHLIYLCNGLTHQRPNINSLFGVPFARSVTSSLPKRWMFSVQAHTHIHIHTHTRTHTHTYYGNDRLKRTTKIVVIIPMLALNTHRENPLVWATDWSPTFASYAVTVNIAGASVL